ncbi:MAG: hypothetical protein JWP29_298 [Rhodoferax sp.]|nr:hypothetical protein [Rhodoferax sp.]
MTENHNPIQMPALKAVTAIGGAAAANYSWSEIASIAAFLYTSLLICEWIWKRMVRPFAERHGWITPRRRRQLRTRSTDLGELDG